MLGKCSNMKGILKVYNQDVLLLPSNQYDKKTHTHTHTHTHTQLQKNAPVKEYKQQLNYSGLLVE